MWRVSVCVFYLCYGFIEKKPSASPPRDGERVLKKDGESDVSLFPPGNNSKKGSSIKARASLPGHSTAASTSSRRRVARRISQHWPTCSRSPWAAAAAVAVVAEGDWDRPPKPCADSRSGEQRRARQPTSRSRAQMVSTCPPPACSRRSARQALFAGAQSCGNGALRNCVQPRSPRSKSAGGRLAPPTVMAGLALALALYLALALAFAWALGLAVAFALALALAFALGCLPEAPIKTKIAPGRPIYQNLQRP